MADNNNNNNSNNNNNNNNTNNNKNDDIKKDEAQLCLRNCGFYGNSKTNGLCSSCYNKESNSNTSLRQQLQQQQLNNSNSSINTNSNNSSINNSDNNNNNNSNNNSNKEESPKSNKKRTLDYLDYSLGGINGSPNSNMFREGLESTSAPSVLLSPHTSPTTTSTTTTTSATSPLKILKGDGSMEDQQPQQASSLSSPLSSPLSSSPSKSNIKCKFLGCAKPIGIMQSMSNKCRCGEHYCGKHIHNHNCTFDYKSLAKSNIAKANPQVLANKIVKL